MHTAIFYSCKGGSGRTMTMANMALLLARLGRNVVCIDLDLEAPGVPEALQTLHPVGQEIVGDARGEGSPVRAWPDGFVEYAEMMLKGLLPEADDTEALDVEAAPDTAERDENLTEEQKEEDKKRDQELAAAIEAAMAITEMEPEGGTPAGWGSLRVLRAGDYTARSGHKYWNLMMSGLLESFFPFQTGFKDVSKPTALNLEEDLEDDPEFIALPGQVKKQVLHYRQKEFSFWGGLRTRLMRLQPTPDYLLVDTRTGFSPLSITSINAFLRDTIPPNTKSIDLFVFGELGSIASRLGTQAFIKHIHVQKTPPVDTFRVHLVCRDQQMLDNQTPSTAAEVKAKNWLEKGAKDEDWLDRVDSYSLIRSDPIVERTGSTLAAPGMAQGQDGLLGDYLALTSLLTGEDSIPERLGLPSVSEQPDFKLFRLPRDGRMHNVDDNAANISFSVGTFRMLVGHLAAGRRPDAEALREAGQRAGEEFAEVLRVTVTSVEPDTEKQDGGVRSDHRQELLARWRRLDSAVGWGRFELRLPNAPEPASESTASADAGTTPPGADPQTRAVDEATFVTAETDRCVRLYGNTFAIPEEDGCPSPELCTFLGGYLCGIVGGLLSTADEHGNVSHRVNLTASAEHEICIAKRPGLDYCEFLLRMAA